MHHRRTPLGFVSLLLLAACTAAPGATGDSLDGHEFLSTAVTEDGADKALADGTRIRIGFEDGQVSANAGCNTMGGAYRLDGNTLVFEGGGMTEMGCDEELHAQDEWLMTFLGSRPTLARSGTDLTLSADRTVLTLIDSEVAEPDLPLTGPTWTVETIITGDAASSVPNGAVATMTFGDDGHVEVNTGCNEGGGRFEVSGDTLRFVDVAITEMACEGPGGELEAAVLPVLSAEGLEWTVDAGSLTLMAGDRGLVLRGS